MNPTSIDINDMLVNESSLGLTFGTNLFIGKEPATPETCATIFDTPGRPPLLTLEGKETTQYYYPSIQIRVRSNSYITGWNLIHDIKVYLHGIAGEAWNGTHYDVVKCIGEPSFLDWDRNDRVRFVSTYQIQRKKG